MNPSLVGSWIGQRSNIPDYIAGREWLHFSDTGEHLGEVLHPGQNILKAKFYFTLREHAGRFYFCPSKKRPDSTALEEYPMDIVKPNDDEISVTPRHPRHGFTTVYRRVAARPVPPIHSP